MDGFRSFATTRIGSRHVVRGESTEDASGTLDRPDLAAVVVADGVSDPRCTHAGIGSELAVSTTISLLTETGLPESGSPEFRHELTVRWNAAVQTRSQQMGIEHHPTKYATTLVFAATDGSRFLLGKLGDGDAFAAVGVPARLIRPFPPDHCEGPITLAHGDAAERMGLVVVDDTDAPRVILVATDGYSAPFAVDDWHAGVATDLLAITESGMTDTIAEAMIEWVAESAQVGGDDASLGLILQEIARSDSGT